jgi:ABC-type transport system involved in multi-copper enzyme maturation permease subunit
MLGSFRAELIKLAKRPATWLLLGVALGLSLIFAYLVRYASYAGGTEGVNTAGGLAVMLPGRLVGNSIGGLPVFLGAIVLINGVLVVGGEYGWSTWKTVLVQGPSRLTVYAAKLLALAVANVALMTAMFGVGAAASATIAAAENQPLVWPSVGDLAIGFGAGWLIASMWTALGVLLAVALRGVALAIGLGLVWMLAVQNLLAVIAAPLLDAVATLQKGLPGPNAGSLTAALGAATTTPGVEELVGAGQASLVVAAYLLGFAALGGVLLHRRDVV